MKKDEKFMEIAIDLADQAANSGNEPFGAILVKEDEIVLKSNNMIHTLCDPTAHAEMSLIRQFCQENKIDDLSDYTLYTSCEPCCMCSGAMVWSKLGKLVYCATHEQLETIAGFNIMISSKEIFEKSPFKPIVEEKILNELGVSVLKKHFI